MGNISLDSSLYGHRHDKKINTWNFLINLFLHLYISTLNIRIYMPDRAISLQSYEYDVVHVDMYMCRKKTCLTQICYSNFKTILFWTPLKKIWISNTNAKCHYDNDVLVWIYEHQELELGTINNTITYTQLPAYIYYGIQSNHVYY